MAERCPSHPAATWGEEEDRPPSRPTEAWVEEEDRCPGFSMRTWVKEEDEAPGHPIGAWVEEWDEPPGFSMGPWLKEEDGPASCSMEACEEAVQTDVIPVAIEGMKDMSACDTSAATHMLEDMMGYCAAKPEHVSLHPTGDGPQSQGSPAQFEPGRGFPGAAHWCQPVSLPAAADCGIYL